MAAYCNIKLVISTTCIGELIETAERLNVFMKKSSLKDDALLIPSVRFIVDLGKQNLSYLTADYSSRVSFAQWYLQQCTFPNFEVSTLFTDEANFSRNAITNYHNNHTKIRIVLLNLVISINFHVWAIYSIIGDFLLGSSFLKSTLNGNNYRQFVETQLPLTLVDVPLQIRNQMWFMHGGAPAHFSRTAREFL
ncbi:hypothetical protein ALC56_11734 [Trachymyrmex septentrionalis]|uniref:Uncharacterized protein n=1 Tax=Trachymyrmex septentrionalis TaxID=34720 RepID=A0A195F023_9HYME|nr:hypothetical protein ALC56_11734 [Trachymyrmex septentrionalis]